MNQTRIFLIFAWIALATLLWMEWGKEKAAPATPVATESASPAVPTATPSVPAAGGAIPTAPGSAPTAAAAVTGTGRGQAVNVTTDVLHVVLDGGEVRQADLLKYPSLAAANSEPVRLFAEDAAHYFVAQSAWTADSGVAPGQQGTFEPEGGNRDYRLTDRELVVPFVWTGSNGVTVRRQFVFQRGSYVVQVRDEVVNASTVPWKAYVYRGLSRVPRAIASSGPMSAEKYSFQGAAWYSDADKYERHKYDEFANSALNKEVTGGWIGMLQHHFFAAWIPQKDQGALFALREQGGRYTVEARGPAFNVAPGGKAETSARLWVGPKLVKQIDAQQVKGLDRAVDFSRFSWAATLAGWLFWVLDKLHGLIGNWGWSIIGLVVLLKALMYPLSSAQYGSMAKMRKFQPRIKQLQERYGDDKQKLQMAMMELYKKEKINPVGGCLPILVQMPVFLCLYWMLSESVELRHAPWIGWITDLTSRDPFFILPAINLGVMWLTQKMTPPAPGMDPMQQKMMQFMPLVFGVLFAFMPAGLVLYWITNGSLGLLQQWWMAKRHAEEPAKAAA
ncbi:membrane protein insertase YidC [Lysobacter terrae]